MGKQIVVSSDNKTYAIVNSNNSYNKDTQDVLDNRNRIASLKTDAETELAILKAEEENKSYNPASNYNQGNVRDAYNKNKEAIEENRKQQIAKLETDIADYTSQIWKNYKTKADLDKAREEKEQFYLNAYEQKLATNKTLNGYSDDPNDYMKDFDGNFDVDNVNNVNHINDTVDIASEDLKYMRELAEREAINQFTNKLLQPQINVTFGEVKETADVDGIIQRITDGLVENLNNSGDVVHI